VKFSILYPAGLNCLATMYLVDIVGPLKFANANGIMNMFRGFGCIVGPYIGGILLGRFLNYFLNEFLFSKI
jgi:MFS family permease